MSVWLEIHCDVRSNGPADYISADPYCYSDVNDGPGMLSSNSSSDVAHALRLLNAEARRAGWVYRSQQWACPRCAKMPVKKTSTG